MIRKLLPDRPCPDSAVGFGDAALALVRLLDQSASPLSIAVVGDAGSGRTTFLRAIEAALETDRFVSIRFSAASWRRGSDRTAALLDSITRGLHERADDARASVIADQLKIIATRPEERAASTPAVGESPTAETAGRHRGQPSDAHRMSLSRRHAGHAPAARGAIAAADLRGRLRLIIFVDDLETCEPLDGRQLVTLARGPLAELGAQFVFALAPSGLDPDLEWKRVVQATYRLPTVTQEHLAGFLAATVAEAELPQSQVEDLHRRVTPFLMWVVGDYGATPRALKVFINAYTAAVEIDHDCRIDPDVLLTVLTIAARPDWWPVHYGLLLHRGAFLRALAKRLGGDRDAVSDLDPGLWPLPDSFFDFLETHRSTNTLLSVEAIGPYLASIEATYPLRSEVPMNALAALGAVRIALRILDEKSSPADDAHIALEQCAARTAALVAQLPSSGRTDALMRSVHALHRELGSREAEPVDRGASETLLRNAREAAQALTDHVLASCRAASSSSRAPSETVRDPTADFSG